MKLPGIRYGPVQSLGRERANAPIALGRSIAGTAQANAAALGVAGKALDRIHAADADAQYERAVAEFKAREAEVRTVLTSGPVIDTQQFRLPEWVQAPRTEQVYNPQTGQTEEVERRFVPTHEVADEIYDGTLARLTSHVLSTTDNAVARKHLQRRLPGMTNRSAVLAKQVGYYRDTQAGLKKVEIERHINEGNEVGAIQAAQRGFATGVLDGGTYAGYMEDIPGRIDKARLTNALAMATTEGDFEDLQDEALASRMTPEDKQAFWDRAERRSDKLRDDWKRSTTERADNIRAQFYQHMMDQGQQVTQEDAFAVSQRLRELGKGEEALAVLKDFEAREERVRVRGLESDPDMLGLLQSDITDILFPPEGQSTQGLANQARREVSVQQARGAISPQDARTLLSNIDSLEQMPYQRESYREVARSIWVSVTGLNQDEFQSRMFRIQSGQETVDPEALVQFSLMTNIAVQARTDLQAAIRAKGAEVDPLEWWDRNRQYYTLDAWTTRARDSFIGRYPEYTPEAGDDASIERKILSDTRISRTEQQRRWRMYKGLLDAGG